MCKTHVPEGRAIAPEKVGDWPGVGVEDKGIVDSLTAPEVISLRGGMEVPAREVPAAAALVVPEAAELEPEEEAEEEAEVAEDDC